jgi:hypothetical protein
VYNPVSGIAQGMNAVKRSMRIRVASLALAPCLLIGLWFAMYPDRDDPKNIHYVLWKWQLASFDRDRALGIMTHDSADSLVVGKAEEELRKRFGYLNSIEEADSYVRYCYFNSPWYGKNVKMLRNSNWMVVFKNGRAAELVLVKGC